MLQAFDLLQTSKNSVIKYFKEDVTNYFIDNNIPVGEDLSLLGKSGRNSKFDIVVGRTRKKPQQAIKVVNTPINSNIANPLFRIILMYEKANLKQNFQLLRTILIVLFLVILSLPLRTIIFLFILGQKESNGFPNLNWQCDS
ncbi:hypothetical protein Lc367_1324 [Lactobacillus crispatus EM-LC1]|nr:hypothetical protein Lc367_1324 [Lactobacillus crispatus EM-LC1]